MAVHELTFPVTDAAEILKLRAGDEVTVTLQPVKSGAPIGRLRNVVLPNGQTLGTGGPPAAAAQAQPAK